MKEILFIIILSNVFSLSINRLDNNAILPSKVIKAVKKVWKKKILSYNYLNITYTEDLDLIEIRSEEELLGFVCLKEAKACRIGGCQSSFSAINEQYFEFSGEYEKFQYYFILDKDLTILKTGVFDYPGDYGFEITSKWWQNQFIGYKGGALIYGKNIDGISGATVSAHSMCFDLEDTYQVVKISILDMIDN